VVAEHRSLPNFREVIAMFLTFGMTVLAWVFFRADSIGQAFTYLNGIFDWSVFTIPEVRPSFLIILIGIFLMIEWAGRYHLYAIERLWLRYPKVVRWAIYYSIVMVIFLYGGKEQEFIYFQF
jgi:hypothetical protein